MQQNHQDITAPITGAATLQAKSEKFNLPNNADKSLPTAKTLYDTAYPNTFDVAAAAHEMRMSPADKDYDKILDAP